MDANPLDCEIKEEQLLAFPSSISFSLIFHVNGNIITELCNPNVTVPGSIKVTCIGDDTTMSQCQTTEDLCKKSSNLYEKSIPGSNTKRNFLRPAIPWLKQCWITL